jgi:hypothetical protein
MVAMLVSLMEGNSSDVHTKFCEDFVHTLQERHYLPLTNNEGRPKTGFDTYYSSSYRETQSINTECLSFKCLHQVDTLVLLRIIQGSLLMEKINFKICSFHRKLPFCCCVYNEICLKGNLLYTALFWPSCLNLLCLYQLTAVFSALIF